MPHFNAYLDLPEMQPLMEYFKQCGRRRVYARGESFNRKGEVCHKIAYISHGAFCYRAYEADGTPHIIGFNFDRDFVVDYESFAPRTPAVISTDSLRESHVYELTHDEFEAFCIKQEPEHHILHHVSESLFHMIYRRLINLYTTTPRQRYELLVKEYPELLQLLDLKEIASFLNITPYTLSRIRQNITFGK